MTTTDFSPDGEVGRPGEPPKDGLSIGAIAVAAIALVLAAVALFLVLRDDDEDVTVVDSTTTTELTTTVSEETTTTTEATTTVSEETTTTEASTTTTAEESTTTSPLDPADYETAVWPWFDSDVRYADGIEAARGFATEFIGFDDPIIGDFFEGDSRSGEVEIQAEEGGAVTTVFVRQLGSDDTWWVLGSATENIVIDEPGALDVVDDPLTLEGRARAFEGTVDVILRIDGSNDPLATTFVTGSGDGSLGAFSAELPFDDPGTGFGAVIFLTRSADDGQVWEASVVRIAFG